MESKDWDKIAKKYHKEVISPFQEGVSNPLLGKLEKIKNSKSKTIADIGCGIGETINFLSRRFKTVYAIDFSPAMVSLAKEQSQKNNVKCIVKDMRNLGEFKSKFDVVISVNSVIMPKIEDVGRSLKSICDTLKKGGEFYGIFPSMESILYQGFLILEDQLKKHDQKKASEITRKILERENYNFITGNYKEGDNLQKFYYDFELKIRLQNAGFKKVRISKVLYPWKKEISSFERFPGKPKMWDWFVSAKK